MDRPHYSFALVGLFIRMAGKTYLVIFQLSLCSTIFTGWMPTILRAGRGMTLWEKARLDPPPKKLELFSYENNPVQHYICITCVNKTVSLNGDAYYFGSAVV